MHILLRPSYPSPTLPASGIVYLTGGAFGTWTIIAKAKEVGAATEASEADKVLAELARMPPQSRKKGT